MSKTEQPTQVRSISLALLKMTKKQKLEVVEGTNGAPQFVARIGGIVANSFDYHDKKTGELRTGFKGLFTLRTHDENIFSSNSTFLPKQIEQSIAKSIREGAVNVQFQYDIFLSENEKSGTGYMWNVEPVLSDDAREKANKLIAELLSGSLPSSPKKLSKK